MLVLSGLAGTVLSASSSREQPVGVIEPAPPAPGDGGS